MRPVRTASGEVRQDTEPAPRRHWWWIGGVWLLVLILAAIGALQWRYDWVDALPHSTVTRAAIAVPVQRVAAPVASTSPAGAIDTAAIARALKPLVTAKTLGPHVEVLVTGLTGSAVFAHGSGPITPASTLKLLTATAALQTRGPQARFATTVRLSGTTLTLVGGGDPYLSTKPSAKNAYPHTASLTDLAAKTAAALKARHLRAVALHYDASLFSGPGLSPAWEPTYFSSGVIAPISALWTDEGSLGRGTLSSNPPATAAQRFAQLLRAHGIVVSGNPVPRVAAPTSAEVARVLSPPLVDELALTLPESDNFAAEVIARHVALATGQPATFVGAAAGIRQTLTRLGIPLKGLVIDDGSGLSRHDRLEPATLAAILRAAATDARLSGLQLDLPVAGFDGSLTRRFERTTATALGLVRAKTGTLTGVHAMAGYTVDASGTPLIFVALSDQVPVPDTLAARDVLDHIAAALTACRCSVR